MVCLQHDRTGGEGGIRSLPVLTASISYRNYIATNAKFATLAADHCTLLHAGVRRFINVSRVPVSRGYVAMWFTTYTQSSLIRLHRTHKSGIVLMCVFLLPHKHIPTFAQ